MKTGDPEKTKAFLILPLLVCAALCAWGFVFKPLLQKRETEEAETAYEEEFLAEAEQLETVKKRETEAFGVVIQSQDMTGNVSLSGAQSELLKEYMNRYMESLAYLECLDFSDLFLRGGEALSESSIAFQIALRQMTEGADYSLLSYSYALICVDAQELEDGSVFVTAEETSTQVFAQTPDVESKRYAVVHTFTMKKKNGEWYLTQHEQADCLYLVLESEGVEEDDIPERYMEVVAGYMELIRERMLDRNQEAQVEVLLASAQEPDEQDTEAVKTEVQEPDEQYTEAVKTEVQEPDEETAETGAQEPDEELSEEEQEGEKTQKDVLAAEDTELIADHPYDRESALAYSYLYINKRNLDSFADYSDVGGNCQNYVSQCLYAGGIPMDTVGNDVWKWYDLILSNTGSSYGRSSSWTGVDEFVTYAENNTGFGLVAEVGAPYFTGEPGDVLQVGTEGDWRHAVLITDVVVDEDGSVIDYLINSNTSNLENYPASLYGYPEAILTKIIGWNEE